MANWVNRIALGAAVVILAPVTARLAVGPGGTQATPSEDRRPATAPAGTAAAAVAAAAAAHLAPTTPLAARASSANWAQLDFDHALCGFLELYAHGVEKGDGSCEQPAAGSVEVMIAVLPDPMHTHLALRFDRAVDDLQNAAQDLSWTFDRAWMPWSAAGYSAAGRYSDRALDTAMLSGREAEPGLILFRASSLLQKPLVVLVVGDTPTSGVNQEQFNQAVERWRWFRTAAASCVPGTTCQPGQRLMILGPTFTGSADSMNTLLDSNFTHEERCHKNALRIVLVSGTMTSFSKLDNFIVKCDDSKRVWQTAAFSFAADFTYAHAHLLSFLDKRLQHADQGIADLSEEESAFGQESNLLRDTYTDLQRLDHRLERESDEAQKLKFRIEIERDESSFLLWLKLSGEDPDSYLSDPALSSHIGLLASMRKLKSQPRHGRLYHFVFPRGISILRKAYEQNSILGFGSGGANSNNPRTELRLNFAEDARDDDTVPAFAGLQGAASMESRMAEIAAALEREKISVVLLSATDVLDDIFVAKYLQTHAPSVTIVIQDADLLFLRGGSETALDGVYVLSPYPLIPRNRTWTLSDWSGRALPSLPPSQGDQGTVNAVRYLLCGAGPMGFNPALAPASCGWRVREHFSSQYLPVAEYEPPFSIPKGWRTYPDDYKLQPPLWLSVIGHGSFQPVTLVDFDEHDNNLSASGEFNLPRLGKVKEDAKGNEEDLGDTAGPRGIAGEPLVQLKLLVLLTGVLSLLHLALCVRARLDRSFAWTYASADAAPWRARVLIHIGINLTAICALSFMLSHDAPSFHLSHPWLNAAIIIIQCGLVAGSGLAAWRSGGSLELQRHRTAAIVIASVFAALFTVGCDRWLWTVFAPTAANFAERNFFFYRSAYPLSGASPTLPLMLLLAALVVWMRGRLGKMVFFGCRIPRLPSSAALDLAGAALHPFSGRELRCPSDDRVHDLNTLLSSPFCNWKKRIWNKQKLLLAALSVASVTFTLLLPDSFGVNSLASTRFDSLIGALAFVVTIGIVHNLLVSWKAWSLLREAVLLPLKQSPLRWGFNWVRGFSWKRLWTSPHGFSLEAQLEYVMRNVEADRRGKMPKDEGNSGVPTPVTTAYRELLREYGDTKELEWERGWRRWWGLSKRESAWADKVAQKLNALSTALARESERRITNLSALWRLDNGPLTGLEAERGYHNVEVPKTEEALSRMADEEFVAMVYLSYIRSVLVQIRNRIATSAVLYMMLLWALTGYPWMNRHRIFLLMCSLVALLGIVAVRIYSEMQRDDVLSRTTSSEPGKLDGEFVRKILSVVGIPLLTLIASQFPEFGSAVFSWVEPGFSALR